MLAGVLLLTAMLTAQHAASDELARRVRILTPDNAAQTAALCSTRPQLAFMGRRHGGKSWTTAAKAVRYADTYGPNHPREYPAARVMLARDERATMTETIVRTLREEILGPELYYALYRATTKDGEDGLYFPNGSSIIFRGLNKPERILGLRYGLCGIDQAEQIDEEQQQIAISGATQAGMPWSQVFFAFNPENPEHWAYQLFRPDEGDGPRYRGPTNEHFADVVHVQEEDCLHFLSHDQIGTLDNLTGTYRDRLRFGRWVAFEGMVYDLWDPRVHIVDPPSGWWGRYPPPDWPRWRAIDFGYNPDPYCCLWLTLSGDGRWYVYRQDYRLKLSLDRQVERILAQQRSESASLLNSARLYDRGRRAHGKRAQRVETYRESLTEGLRYTGVSDHGTDQRIHYARHGVKSWPAEKEIYAGIETFRNLLDPNQEGGPRFLVIRDSLIQRDKLLTEKKRPTCLEEEIGRYLWGVAKSAAGAKVLKDLPVDANNHALDAARYAVHTWSKRRSLLFSRDREGPRLDEEDES